MVTLQIYPEYPFSTAKAWKMIGACVPGVGCPPPPCKGTVASLPDKAGGRVGISRTEQGEVDG